MIYCPRADELFEEIVGSREFKRIQRLNKVLEKIDRKGIFRNFFK